MKCNFIQPDRSQLGFQPTDIHGVVIPIAPGHVLVDIGINAGHDGRMLSSRGSAQVWDTVTTARIMRSLNLGRGLGGNVARNGRGLTMLPKSL